jgi:hypothetical protein
VAVSLGARNIISMARSQFFIVVAIAGLVRPIHVRAQKLLEHCGVTAIEIPFAPEALDSLRKKVRLNALVLDARSLEPSDQPAPAFVAMASSGGESSVGFAPMPVIVLGNRHVPEWVRPICERTGARFFTTREKSSDYPALIRLLRDMCGIEDVCCRPIGMSGGEAGR